MNQNIPCWDEYFMKMADLVKTKSKDRSTQVGAIIVGEGHTVLSIGYNGFPRGVNDNVDIRHERPIKYMYTEHAERNAIYSAARNGIKLLDSVMYLSAKGVSCADCARAIIQAGIKEVISKEGKFEGAGSWEESCRIAKEMFLESNVKISFLNEKYERSK